MLWKIYFWVFIVILILGYFSEGFIGIWDAVDLVITSGALAGLFLYGYKKKLFNASFWKAYFPIFIVWDFSYNLVIEPRARGVNFEIISLIGFLFVIPIYIALYLYAFKFMSEK